MAPIGPLISASSSDLIETRKIPLAAMRESARQARDCICLEQPECKLSKLTRLAGISRAVWFQNVQLANILIESGDLARGFLELGKLPCFLIAFPFLKKSLKRLSSATLRRRRVILSRPMPLMMFQVLGRGLTNVLLD